MNTVIKLLIIVSLLLTPFSGSAADVMPMPASHVSDNMNEAHAMHATHTEMANHDCCDTEQQTNVSQATHQQCDNSCGDCQHHCSSSASGLIAVTQLPFQAHPHTKWPTSHGVPLARHESQIRPPMSA
ncbi:hypothetical protein [Pseudidiomarina donghaiensis]|uniref:CopL family metal-binding regulatory protein n=1 Tax=Pseudidiomarina donghaiensis TaxID=519452 RepID=A0A432XKK6_9GAMM|nr:hypothetical protein [Pseudidiomarina donghaiensis]RUO49202.1 hypothetical protein CWE24_01460 [Pseudidiomarina donghaiensis]